VLALARVHIPRAGARRTGSPSWPSRPALTRHDRPRHWLRGCSCPHGHDGSGLLPPKRVSAACSEPRRTDQLFLAGAALAFACALWVCLAACECGIAISAAAGRRRKRRRMVNLHTAGKGWRWMRVSSNHLASPCRHDEIGVRHVAILPGFLGQRWSQNMRHGGPARG
jgi:hypothetical protein